MNFIMHFITRLAAKRRYMSLHAELPALTSLPAPACACLRMTFECCGRVGFWSAAEDSELCDDACRENHTKGQPQHRATRESAGMIVARAVLATQHGHAQSSPGSRTVEYHENERVALPTLTCRSALVDKFFLSAHKCKVGARQLSAARSASSRADGSAAE